MAEDHAFGLRSRARGAEDRRDVGLAITCAGHWFGTERAELPEELLAVAVPASEGDAIGCHALGERALFQRLAA